MRHCFFPLLFCLTLGIGLLTLPDASRAQTTEDTVPYDDELMRLAEVMGALHSLQPMCGPDEAPTWRDRMIALLDVETEPGNRRRRYIEHFNQGYRGFSSTYRTCTPAARLAMKQYVSEGQTLIRNVTGRFSR
ncbi:TIGR02301 family protein [Roseibium sp. CAU 1637]|uniref:TIGR02301 family protein n=1 Tax=Roseibium limicola TaxID=2816037 RepID=A0A939J940_9HYPH|nr:TIGR02301 family protein [Roseibium limicola]MBO0345504.1 TIGR02301 family protein [Roseibium limicola]